MGIARHLLGWLGRRGALFVLLVAALLIWQERDRIGRFADGIQSAAEAHRSQARKLEDAANEIANRRKQFEKALKAAGREARSGPAAQLAVMLDRAEKERAQLAGSRRSDWQKARSLATFDAKSVIADRTLELKIEMLDRKILGLETALSAAHETGIMRRRSEAAISDCLAALARLRDLEDDWPPWRNLRERLKQERTRVAENARDRCITARRSADQWKAAQSTRRAAPWNTMLADRTADILERAEEERVAAEATLEARFDRFWREARIGQVLWTAAGLLIGIILLPYAIRILFYFVLAPLAERRASIVLQVPGGSGVPLPPAERSATSVTVSLDPGEELLVRQNYLQSSSLKASKSTRWLLDARHPFSSLASGLWFLTCIRGGGEVTTVSAVRDPFAEVTVLALPEGASCVLHPRALAAVALRVGSPLRITSHWRLFSLNAWLTQQLRYLVFHGPVRLVLKGGRGVRVEQAERGRIFGQDQLIGFSADVAYSVTRTETFWPYFLGRESLLKDRIEGGSGALILEEAPLSTRAGSQARRRLEGTLDAMLKAVGL